MQLGGSEQSKMQQIIICVHLPAHNVVPHLNIRSELINSAHYLVQHHTTIHPKGVNNQNQNHLYLRKVFNTLELDINNALIATTTFGLILYPTNIYLPRARTNALYRSNGKMLVVIKKSLIKTSPLILGGKLKWLCY